MNASKSVIPKLWDGHCYQHTVLFRCGTQVGTQDCYQACSCHYAAAGTIPARFHGSLLQNKAIYIFDTSHSGADTRQQQEQFPASFIAASLQAPSRGHNSFLTLHLKLLEQQTSMIKSIQCGSAIGLVSISIPAQQYS